MYWLIPVFGKSSSCKFSLKSLLVFGLVSCDICSAEFYWVSKCVSLFYSLVPEMRDRFTSMEAMSFWFIMFFDIFWIDLSLGEKSREASLLSTSWEVNTMAFLFLYPFLPPKTLIPPLIKDAVGLITASKRCFLKFEQSRLLFSCWGVASHWTFSTECCILFNFFATSPGGLSPDDGRGLFSALSMWLRSLFTVLLKIFLSMCTCLNGYCRKLATLWVSLCKRGFFLPDPATVFKLFL